MISPPSFTIVPLSPMRPGPVKEYEVRTSYDLYFTVDFTRTSVAKLSCHRCRFWDAERVVVLATDPNAYSSAFGPLATEGGPICGNCREAWPEGPDLRVLQQEPSRSVFEAWLINAGCNPFDAVMTADALYTELETLLCQYLEAQAVAAGWRR